MGALRLTLILLSRFRSRRRDYCGYLAAGFSINILTLLALVLATGMIVDDAIVVIENIQRQRALGLKPFAASVMGTHGILRPGNDRDADFSFLPIAFLQLQRASYLQNSDLCWPLRSVFLLRRSFALRDVGIRLPNFGDEDSGPVGC